MLFFDDTATTELYTLSLHDALPIWCGAGREGRRDEEPEGGAHRRARAGDRAAQRGGEPARGRRGAGARGDRLPRDRKSTRLNSSHMSISYAVFCLKKKKT